jgi:hypothetical protein
MMDNKKIIIKSFSNELQKEAALSSLFKFAPKLLSYATGAKNAIKAGKTLSYLEAYATPAMRNAKKGMSAAKELTDTGWIQRSIGDSVKSIRSLKAGVNLKAPVTQNAKKILRNMYTVGRRQLRDSRYRTVDLGATKKTLFGKKEVLKYPTELKNGKSYLKGKGIMPNRQIKGYTAGGKAIVKKRALSQAAAATITPVGFGATSAITGGPKEGLKETAMWTVAKPVAEVNLLKDLIL